MYRMVRQGQEKVCNVKVLEGFIFLTEASHLQRPVCYRNHLLKSSSGCIYNSVYALLYISLKPNSLGQLYNFLEGSRGKKTDDLT